jgi:hypothetical protein
MAAYQSEQVLTVPTSSLASQLQQVLWMQMNLQH